MKTRAKGYRNVRVLREEDKEKGEAQKEREREERERERERERETVGDEEGRGDFECVRGNSFHLFFLLQIQFWLSIYLYYPLLTLGNQTNYMGFNQLAYPFAMIYYRVSFVLV